MIENIGDVPRIESTLIESELQVSVACKWLGMGIPSMAGGEKLTKWLAEHLDNVESIFGSDDRVYIRCKNPLTNKRLVEFVIKEKIGDEIQWIKCKDSDRWWLMVWWD